MRLLRTIDRLRLKNKNFSIICNNCIGTLIYHKHNLPFLSPTINMQISPDDYIKFCDNLKYYLSLDLEEFKECDDSWFRSIGGDRIEFPVGRLGDIVIYFQHYKTFEEANRAWIRRKARINFDNLYFILLDNKPSVETIQKFNALEYPKKLYMYYSGEYEFENCFKIKNLENTPYSWYQDMPRFWLKKKFFEQFDFEKWLSD